ncbi:uncharacterized protein TOT_010000332 [Theileria orientalis strain Shintoku]|uniref:Uncharacterized protein n=1 Tax=Theileria orientalis strain Shintoku TaxID=869250 RepID=J4D5C7_THEOR|nr:uncharacterized protein TOT_010000332 [Theileria orientalis strain Shintoku]BAM38865.1 uncharacterized protein TOT_010000332 [Theileria orientalis strain Shintoku]|eukprot:XP_009689166.1 uncharacterized protein TOT_010000332 [Theileria orientalis strain Shintoku]
MMNKCMVGYYSRAIDSHIEALGHWYDKLPELINFDETDYSSDDETPATRSREIESNKLKCLALFLLANVSFINSIVDSSVFKALCISFFDKNYHLPYEPIFIFNYLIETFKPNLDYSDPFTTPLKRGEYIFRLLRYGLPRLIFFRALKTLKGSHDIITMKIWCEFFDTKDSLWKCVDFATPKFDMDVYKYKESSSYLEKLSKRNEEKKENDDKNDDRDLEVEMEFKKEYNNYLYIHRSNKMFVYRNLERPEAVCIVVFPKYTYRLSRMLQVREYPFESSRRIERLKESFSEKGPNTLKHRKLMRSPSRKVFILSCNIGGMVSEVTSKYLHKDLSYLRSSSFIKWFNDLLLRLNQRSIQSHMYGSLKNKDTNGNRDLTTSNIDILNANLLENVDSRFIKNLVSSFPIPTKKTHFVNHPIYVLKSQANMTLQIKRACILKKGSLPVSSFDDELVYLKSDVEEMKTRFGWFKENRQVKPDSEPVLLHTEFRNKKFEYYSMDQTEPLKQDNIDELDSFTVNLSGKRYVPENSVYIRSKHYEHLETICHKHKIFFKRAYSSLHYEDGSLKPKIDGILIRSDQLESFLGIYDEEVNYIVHGQLDDEVAKSCKFWKNVFKTLLNSPPVNKAESVATLKKNIQQHTSTFLNQLI